MKEQVVHTVSPAGAGKETLWVFLLVVVVLLCWSAGIYARLRKEPKPKLQEWQLDSFSGLRPVEQAVYSDLRAAAEEVWQVYLEETRWAGVEELSSGGVSPFEKGLVWKQRGRIDWQERVANSEVMDMVIYLGLSPEPKICGSFLLEVHKHKQIKQDGPPYTIWYHSGKTEWPLGVLQQFMVAEGWKQVVPYSGAEELRRLKGSY